MNIWSGVPRFPATGTDWRGSLKDSLPNATDCALWCTHLVVQCLLDCWMWPGHLKSIPHFQSPLDSLKVNTQDKPPELSFCHRTKAPVFQKAELLTGARKWAGRLIGCVTPQCDGWLKWTKAWGAAFWLDLELQAKTPNLGEAEWLVASCWN